MRGKEKTGKPGGICGYKSPSFPQSVNHIHKILFSHNKIVNREQFKYYLQIIFRGYKSPSFPERGFGFLYVNNS
ncbi:MAG: hypothetical protein J7L31_00900 [Thermoplasmata archaeon]|jgi:hypothetical protein|nr:hypothetical protein [Thermoplasmata archaeon]